MSFFCKVNNIKKDQNRISLTSHRRSMNDSNCERSKSWNIYTNSNPSSSSIQSRGPWKNLGTSMNAISFGFVATAILISMFVIMAIFKHLFRPNNSFSSTQDGNDTSFESIQMQKIGNHPYNVPMAYAADFSVLMPGQRCPTYITQPAPLRACSREGVYWPPHEHDFTFPKL